MPTTTSDSSTGPGPASSSSSGNSEIILDVGFGTEETGKPIDQEGCRKVDFLFVIDNSGSMGGEQNNLIASFPGFIDTIQSTIKDAQDYHIMVIDTDEYPLELCGAFCQNECFDDAGVCNVADEICLGVCLQQALICGGLSCADAAPMECEDVLGAGVTWPRGGDASNTDCNFASGRRYIDSSEPDLSAAFECAARVGTGSTQGTERPMEAMVQAVTPQTEAFVCNEGFVRDDAILVVTFITDEDDGNGDSAGTVDGWRAALISAKNGDESAVVVLGLFGDNDEAAGICTSDGAEPSARLRAFTESWGPRGIAGSVCANNYNSFFDEAVGVIDTTCEDFQPPEG